MSLPDPRAHHAQDARRREAEMARLRKNGRLHIAIKLTSFILGLLGFSRYLAPDPGLAVALLAGFAAVFSTSAILHERIIRRTAAEKRLLQVDEEELRALDGEFLSFGDAGEEFADPVHPYSSDLDLFGLHSLFHFLGRTATGPGRRTLAQALLRPSTGPEIREAQGAIRELAGKPDFRLVSLREMVSQVCLYKGNIIGPNSHGCLRKYIKRVDFSSVSNSIITAMKAVFILIDKIKISDVKSTFQPYPSPVI
jgi:hypothetical protein